MLSVGEHVHTANRLRESGAEKGVPFGELEKDQAGLLERNAL